MKIRYPDYDEIASPTDKLPPNLVAEVKAITTSAVAYLRTTTATEVETQRKDRLSDDAAKIFRILSRGRLEEGYADAELLRQALNRDAEVAHLDCIHWAFKLAHSNRMPYTWHHGIERRLEDEVEAVITDWWVGQAGSRPDVRPHNAPPTTQTTDPHSFRPRYGVRDTPKSRQIEEFRRRIEASGRPVQVSDMMTFCGYKDPTMFQRVQREASNASDLARSSVERMLRCSSADEFWRIVEANRKNRDRKGNE